MKMKNMEAKRVLLTLQQAKAPFTATCHPVVPSRLISHLGLVTCHSSTQCPTPLWHIACRRDTVSSFSLESFIKLSVIPFPPQVNFMSICHAQTPDDDLIKPCCRLRLVTEIERKSYAATPDRSQSSWFGDPYVSQAVLFEDSALSVDGSIFLCLGFGGKAYHELIACKIESCY
jgi:hypothetical protein